MNRDSTTTAETDRAENIDNLKHLLEAHAALLHDSAGKQVELSRDLASCKNALDGIQVNTDQSQTQGAGASTPIYNPQDMLDKIKSEVELIREKLADRENNTGELTDTEPATPDSFTSALAITSNVFAVMLSGTMIVSAHNLASQARKMSTVARRFEIDVPLREHLVDQRPVDAGGYIREAKDIKKGSSSASTDAVKFERPAAGSEARTYQGNVYEGPVTRSRSLRDKRTSKVREIEGHGEVASKQRSASCGPHIQAGTAGQSESCADQKSLDGSWNSSTTSPVRKKRTAEEGREPNLHHTVTTVRKLSSSDSPLRDTC